MVTGIVIAATTVLATLIFVIGDRLRPRAWRHADDAAASSMVLELISTMFSAVAAFVVVICWQNYDNAGNHTATEAGALIDAYWAAHNMPEPAQHRIQSLIQDYTQQVIGREWSSMEHEHCLDQRTQTTLDNIRDAVAKVKSDDTAVSDMRSEAQSALGQVAEARQARAMSASGGIPEFLYWALWFTTALVLLSPVLSGVRITRRSVLMVALLGVMLGTLTLTVRNLDEPFSGGNQVSRDPFENALSRYQHIS